MKTRLYELSIWYAQQLLKSLLIFVSGLADVPTEDMPPLEADDDDADQQKMEEVD